MLVNAMLHQDYPPISLPKREYMERARDIWENELNLKPLKPDAPWYGYSLGAWAGDLERQAQRAVQGDYWETGRIAAQHRRKDVEMNSDAGEAPEEDDL